MREVCLLKLKDDLGEFSDGMKHVDTVGKKPLRLKCGDDLRK